MEQERTKQGWNEQETPKTEAGISETWNEFVENSTLHGLRNSVVRKSVFVRLVWSLLVISAFSFLAYSTIMSIERFFLYQTTFGVSQKRNHTLVFPAVTVCSQNIADKKKILALDNDHDFKHYGLNISACAATAKLRNNTIPCGRALLCACISEFGSKSVVPDCNNSLQKEILNILVSSKVEFDAEEFFYKFSENWSENLHLCSFGMYKINCANLFEPILKEERLCYTFNSERNDVFESYYPGASDGLRILLKSERDRHYYPKFFEGFSVFLNEPGDVVSVAGINAGLGLLTSISMEITKYTYQEYPYPTACGKKTLKGFAHYSKAACYAECWSDYFYKTCRCRPAGIGGQYFSEFNDSTLCYSIHSNCTSQAYLEFTFTWCSCPVPCEVTLYNSEVSYGSLPHKTTTGVQQYFQTANYSEENYAVIEVGFKSLTYTLIDEKPTFTGTALLGEIGGNMGLLLGCSMLTLVEFLDVLFSLITLRFRRRDVNPQ